MRKKQIGADALNPPTEDLPYLQNIADFCRLPVCKASLLRHRCRQGVLRRSPCARVQRKKAWNLRKEPGCALC